MSRRQDLMSLLSEARPGGLEPGPGVESIDLTTITAYPQANLARRASRGRLLLTAGLLPTAAMAAVAVAVVIANQPANNPRPDAGQSVAQAPTTQAPTKQAPRTVREMLLAAAEQTERAEARSGRYWVRKTENGSFHRVGPAGRQYTVIHISRMDRWQATDPADVSWNVGQHLGAAPATAADKAAWEADGSPTQWLNGTLTTASGPVTSGPDMPRPRLDGAKPEPYRIGFGGMGVTVPELLALPTTPTALTAALVKMRKDKGSILINDEDIFLYHCAVQLVFELPATPQVRSAAYRMMAGLKGVTMLGATADRQGRKGVAVAYTRRGDGGNLTQTRLIIDPQTGQALASESWDLGQRSSATGKLVEYTLVISAGYTADAPPKATPAGPTNRPVR